MQGQARLEVPKETWFFEKENGHIVFAHEDEAWRIYSGKNQILRVRTYPPKIIGVGDGKTYYQAVMEATELQKQGKMEEAQARLRRGFDEELEKARATIKAPRNFDVIDHMGRPTNTSTPPIR